MFTRSFGGSTAVLTITIFPSFSGLRYILELTPLILKLASFSGGIPGQA
ncbi:MAG: hypothetical protein JRN20_12640 [Nitrososphaerota archaeon]|nr:hypothetical protein [Nitrososphaerota archaeon]